MISHLPLRIAASLFTMAAVLHPAAGRCQPVAAAAGAAPVGTMDHISIVSIGKGSPVILIPGMASPRATWDGIVPALAKSHRVILVQVNGFGGDAPGANLRPGILEGVVADLHAYLVREKLSGAAVVGHSLGGLLAMKLALAHPGDAGRLMIVDALSFYGRMFGPGVTPAMLEPQAAAMRDAMVEGYGKPATPAAVERTASTEALKPDARAKLAAWISAADGRVAGQALYEGLAADVTADLPRIAVPVTLVLPYNDRLPQAKVDALYRDAYKGTPRLTVVEIGDAAHFVMLDQPAAFGRALDAFLAA